MFGFVFNDTFRDLRSICTELWQIYSTAASFLTRCCVMFMLFCRVNARNLALAAAWYSFAAH